MTQIIYAPLRERYYDEKKSNKCPFCDTKDRSELIIFDGNTAYIIANKYPYSNGHLMVVPKRHIKNLEELNKDEDKDVMLLIKRAIKFLKETFHPDGFDIGINQGQFSGGSIVDHLHVHVVPRYKGDTGFLQTTSDATLISISPADAAKKIKQANGLR